MDSRRPAIIHFHSILVYRLLFIVAAAVLFSKKCLNSAQEQKVGYHSMKEGFWLRKLLEDVGCVQVDARTIMCDNQGCIALAKNVTRYSHTKLIDV